MPSIVTLLTDFGSRDYFVGAMKGVILGRCPDAVLVDISHEIAAHDVAEAAFTLRAASACFPEGTVHVAVVDPGVGSDRRPIVIGGSQRFVGPDNGIFSWVRESEPSARAFHITDRNLLRQPVSGTFHGRDVFAPVAAALVGGLQPEAVGPEVLDLVRLPFPGVETKAEGVLTGCVLHVDRFGNCVTNIERTPGVDGTLTTGFALRVAGSEVRSFRRHYGEPIGSPSDLFVIWGSAGYLEIAANGRSAAEVLGAKVGAPLTLLRRADGLKTGRHAE